MTELLAPAGSAEGVSAAVQSGADAVYLSFSAGEDRGRFDLTEDELGRACQFCRMRGVKLYVCLDVRPTDAELPAALEVARRAQRMGADAIIAQDLGLIWALRRALPSMPIHAGAGLGIHDEDGLRLCRAMGLARAALPRELPFEEIKKLSAAGIIDLEAAVHGPLCPACSGKCALSGAAVSGGPCRGECLSYFTAGARERPPLGLLDLCLADELGKLTDLGIAAVRIDGRERRPEYAAAVTGVYSRALGTGRRPSAEDRKLLEGAFPAGGFTRGFFAGSDVSAMRGVRGAEPQGDTPFYAAVRKNYLNHEFQRVPVTFEVELKLETPVRLTAADDRGNTVSGTGAAPELAFHTPTTPAMLRTELFNTGGTPFRCDGVTAYIEKGVYIDPKKLAPVRDELLSQLLMKRIAMDSRAEGVVDELPPAPAVSEPPVLTVMVRKCSQLSPRLLSLAPPVIYLPLEEAVSGDKRLDPFLEAREITVCPVLPPVILSGELGRVAEQLFKARQMGLTEVMAGYIGHIILARKLGFEVRGDTYLNVRGSNTLAVLLGLRLKSAAVSQSLSSAEVRTLRKYIDTELVVYGRMPLMYTAGCVIKAQTGVCSCDSFSGIPDAQGFMCPVTRSFGCRNVVWSAAKLHLAPRSREYLTAGLWGVRLNFTTENADEVVRITERYLEMGTYEPSTTTQGKF